MFNWIKSFFKKEEMLPLPLTMPEFDKWADRIIEGAALPIGKGLSPYVTPKETQKFALAQMLMELQKVESFKSDVYFMHRLRNAAISQVALQAVEDLQKTKSDRMREDQEKVKAERQQKENDLKSAKKVEAKDNVIRLNH